MMVDARSSSPASPSSSTARCSGVTVAACAAPAPQGRFFDAAAAQTGQEKGTADGATSSRRAARASHVWDRHGEHCYEISLTTTSPVSALEWDKDGDCLAILQEGQGLIPIWDMQYREVTRLDTALKDPSYMKWSRSGPQLVIGTAKGNVMVYNRHSRKKVNVLGKHPRRISCGAWLCGNQPLVWVVLTKLENSLARPIRSRIG
ncbi:hypothetical protein JL721_1812 [Aureococcus anophagefferens]|nr:hypothetical protein JL721_1812 [Aureococcus anophagefferens]